MKVMGIKVIKYAFILLVIAVIAAGCNKQPGNGYDENVAKEKFCSYLNVENIDETIPIVNEFLSEQTTELSEEQKLQELVAWLESCSCIIDVVVLTQSTPTNEIVVSFDENGTTKQFVMDVSMEKPLKVVGYQEYDPKEKFCLYVNEENIDKTIPIVNEFLNNQSTGMSEEQKLQELLAWLQSCPCIIDAAVLSQFNNETPPMSELVISIDENELMKEFIIDVSMGKTLKVTGYRVYDPKEKFCSHLNEENIGQTIPIVNEFLSRLSSEISDWQQLMDLAAWLQSCPCMIDAWVLDNDFLPIQQIAVSFDENGITKNFYMDISMSRPLKTTGYQVKTSESWHQRIAYIQLQEITEESLIYVVYTIIGGGADEYKVEYEEMGDVINVNILCSQTLTAACYCMVSTNVVINKDNYCTAIISSKVRTNIGWLTGNGIEFTDYRLIDSKEISLKY